MSLGIDDIRRLVDTIVIVMMENRSFDHLLGHLSYGEHDTGTGVDGLREPLEQQAYENIYAGEPYYPFLMTDGRLPSDLPHEREAVATQLAYSPVSGKHEMSGFAEAYFQFTHVNWTKTPEALGFLTPDSAPISGFLAENFAVCDRWFAPLPASTLPNRLMAWTGSCLVDHTGSILPPRRATILEWLTDHDVPWRVYPDGLSFFALLGEIVRLLGPNFRPFERLAYDFMYEKQKTFPRVVFVEPSYGDAPHLGNDQPNDNHPPLPVAPGEQFLRMVYRALTANPDRWAKTVLIVMYDEHGGFFDHVPPLPIGYDPRPDGTYPPFETTGPRVPAIVVSPLVQPGSVHHENMDHTSVLQFLAEMFGSGPYCQEVEDRRTRGITSLSNVLVPDQPRAEIPIVPDVGMSYEAVADEASPAKTPQQALFQAGAEALLAENRARVKAKYPELWHWKAMRDVKEGPV